jgi:uncharacterized alpha-E superfamily protein
MLSRIASSLFWIGRYIERGDGTARILDVHLQLLLEDPWIDEDTACRSLLSVMGSEAPTGELAREDVLRILAVDRTAPASIVYSLSAARENARRAREIVSTEMWECLNTTSARMPRRVTSDKVHEFFTWVRDRTALAVGIMESGASRDEAWQFFTLGRSLERADMTARLLATRSLTEASGPSWTTILRSCGAYEAYLRTYRGVPSARNAAEFLLHDRLFPRSILFSIAQAADSLREIEPRLERAGVSDRAQRLLGQIQSELEFRPVTEVLDDLPAHMSAIQDATSAATEAIRRRYFPENIAPSWIGDKA